MKSRRFNFSKVLMMFMFMILTSLVLVACGDKDQDLVDEAVNTVAITYASGDSQNSVTKNLTLPQSIGEVTVTWASGNTSVISNTGVVTRPESDTEVTLTATLTLGDAEETVQITVTVKAAEAVTDPLDALEAIEITGSTLELVGSVYETTTDIVLPATSMGLNITWSTSNDEYVGVDGSVTRPNFGIADQVITLTATIQGEEAQFLIKVLAFTEKPVSQILEEARVALLLDGVSGGVATDLNLPATVGSEGVTVTWSSSDTDVIANDGTVTRPEMGLDDVTVTLTATLSLNSQSVTKEFEILVLADIPPTLFANVADVLENADSDTFVLLEDVTVIGITDDTYFFADSTGLMMVYNSSQEVVVGEVYDIYGLYEVRYGAPQFSATKVSTMPTVATPSDGEVTVLTPTIIDYIQDYTPAQAPTYDSNNIFVYEYLEITAQVRVQGTGSYDTVFVNADYSGGNIDTSATSSYANHAFMIYYKSNKAAFNDLDGEIVRFNAILYGYRSDRTIYSIIFTGEAEDIESSEDIEAVVLAKLALRGSFNNEYIEDASLNLPVTSTSGATISWSTDSTLIDVTTGALTMPETGYEEVILTATITSGDEESIYDFNFLAGDLPNTEIYDARQLSPGHLVKVTGVITQSEYYRTFFLQDETGGIAMYSSNADVLTFFRDNVGKEVTILGERKDNSGLIRMENLHSYELVGEATLPEAENVDDFDLSSAGMMPFQGMLVELTNLYVSEINVDSFNNITVTLSRPAEGTSIDLKWDSRVTLSEDADAAIKDLEVGDVVSVVNVMAWLNGPFLQYASTTQLSEGTLSVDDELALDALEISLADKYFVDTILTLPTVGTYGSTITWESSDSDLIDTATGALVLPEDGFAYVTLTAILTKGDKELEVDFTIRLGVSTISGATDLFFSEYIEGSSNNKALEIFNGTGSDVDLTPYSVLQYSNGGTSASNVLDLEGILPNGEVYVIYNSGSVDAIKNVGNIASAVTYFNGNDAIELVKDGTVIDVIGEVGVDEYWTVGDGSLTDHTVVRVETVTGPNTVFTESEWITYPMDTFTYLGTHTMIDASSSIGGDYETSFETASKASYAVGVVEVDGIDWELSEALIGNLDNDKKIGDFSVRGRAAGYAEILNQFANVTQIDFQFAHYGTLTEGILSLEISNDEGTTWVEVWIMDAGTYATLTQASVVLDYDTITGISASDLISVRWVFGGTTGNNSRMNLDDVKIIMDNATEETLTFDYVDAGLAAYADGSFTIDGVEFGFVEFSNYDGKTMQGRANTGRLYNLDELNIIEVIVTFDPDQQYDPTFTFFGGYSALDEDTALTAEVEGRVYTYDFSDTDFTHFLIRNDNFALYIMEVTVIYLSE